jgi:hypothetical protein
MTNQARYSQRRGSMDRRALYNDRVLSTTAGESHQSAIHSQAPVKQRLPSTVEGLFQLGSHLLLLATAYWRFTLAGIVTLSASLSCAFALARRPWCDEAWLANPAYNLIRHGFMGTTILDSHGFIFAPFIEGLQRFTFWIMPMYVLIQSAWYQIVGFQLFTMRALSMAWGIVALLAWFSIVKQLTGKLPVALLATFLLGAEQHFVTSAATGRMDMMCAALGLLSFAVYLRLRVRLNITAALSASSWILAVAVFTHPNALFAGLMLGVYILLYDRKRLNIRSVLLAGLPFLIFGASWAMYVMQAPEAFASQMSAQSKIPHRFALPLNLPSAIYTEVTERYGRSYRLFSPFPLNVPALICLFYLGSIVLAAAVRQLRNSDGVRFLLALTGISFLLLTCLQKNWYYLVFILPLYAALGAVSLTWLWKHSRAAGAFAVIVVCVVTAVHMGVIGAKVARNDYRNQFLRVTEYLRRDAPANAVIMGSGELAFELGFDAGVVDDARLGYGSGRRADYIVIDPMYGVYWFRWLATHEPDAFAYMQKLLESDYQLVLDTNDVRFTAMNYSEVPYRIYKHKDIK